MQYWYCIRSETSDGSKVVYNYYFKTNFLYKSQKVGNVTL